MNNEDTPQNHTFIQQIHINDDTSMTTNDFDRYANVIIINTFTISMIILEK
jgi:hypothetical protein